MPCHHSAYLARSPIFSNFAGNDVPGCSTNYNGFGSSSGTGPRFGKGLPTKPLFAKEGPEASCVSGSVESWPNVRLQAGKITPPHPAKQVKLTPGPGSYGYRNTFDTAASRKIHATMGLPHQVKRENIPPAPQVPRELHKVQTVCVKSCAWQPRRSGHSDVTPGPADYHTCDSAFCACTNCEKIAQGKTFGLRPSVYTGQIPRPSKLSPAEYHVDCTTLGAATRYVDCHEPRTHP
jgi:hypothetical protein